MINFDDLSAEINAKNEEFERQAAAFREDLQKKFSGLVTSFFEACPQVQAVVWNQYTPYFNDGEECVFSVNDIYFITQNFDVNELMSAYDYEDAEEYGLVETKATQDLIDRYRRLAEEYPKSADYYNNLADSYARALENPELSSRCKALRDVIESNEDIMKSIFGDHMTVYLTPEKSFAEEYDHD